MIVLPNKYNDTFSKSKINLKDICDKQALEICNILNELNSNYKKSISFEMLINNKLYQCHADYIIRTYKKDDTYFSTKQVFNADFYLIKKSILYYFISLFNKNIRG